MIKTKLEINSEDYHDYVIKDGRLIGEFEQMYQKAKDVPWRQDEQDGWDDVKLTVDMLNKFGPFDHIVDFTSGLGYYLKILARAVGSANCVLTGFDVSPTCCKRGKDIFPEIDFRVCDLMDPETDYEIRKRDDGRRLFVLRGSLWYVFSGMQVVVENVSKAVREGDVLAVVQNFPPLEGPFVGKEVIPSPEALVKWFERSFRLVRESSCKDSTQGGYDYWYVGLFQK